MLAHLALPSFVPGFIRLARLNARLNAAHLLRPNGTLGQAQTTLFGRRAPASLRTFPPLLLSAIGLNRCRGGRCRKN
jgi:hypothetical protein